jgi:integrase/recombinase XerD
MRNDRKVYYTFEWGKKPGQRKASGIFTFSNPSSPIEREHNKEALRVLAVKRGQLLLDWQAIGTGLIPMHRLQVNFLDFYDDYVERNKRFDPRRLPASFVQFKRFINKDFLSSHDLTSDLCLRFRQYLLDHFNGYTPGSYFARFKRVMKDAAQQRYFRIDPCADISIKNKDNIQRKEHLEAEEYIRLINQTFRRYRPRDLSIVINKLPDPDVLFRI